MSIDVSWSLNIDTSHNQNAKMQHLDFSRSVFCERISVPQWAQVVFVADMFADDFCGGAELTTEALIRSSPYRVFRIRSKDVTAETLREGADVFWVFGNFASLDPKLIPSIIAGLRYSVLEYDYKFCVARSPEKHFEATGMPCDCANSGHGRLVSEFYRSSMGLWWMSERQKERYETAFPFLAKCRSLVLSSVFDDETLRLMATLHAKAPVNRAGWIVLGSDSWVKGARDAEQWCISNKKQYDVVWGLPYAQLLERLSRAEGFVYLPKGGDTCPRMVIEAKLLGCKLQLNEHVQHKDEAWFNTDELQDIQDYLLGSTTRFWRGISSMIDSRQPLSGYTTTYNCIKQSYPFKECISSMLQFCDEVCVVDGGSDDGTWDELVKLMHPDAFSPDTKLSYVEQICLIEDIRAIGSSPLQEGLSRSKIRLKQVQRDWTAKRHPVFDGMQKAAAREMCTGAFCWQMDSDEVVHEDDAKRISFLCDKISFLCDKMPSGVDIVSLPVIEYWGGPSKVRIDVMPWKWRLSRNLPHITHGIPAGLRRFDEDGNVYAAHGTDGCDMIDKRSGEPLPHATFYDANADAARQAALAGDQRAVVAYERWFNDVVSYLPAVFHYSWYDIGRKVRLYRDYWQNHWNALWDKDTADTAENNMMFQAPWSEITDEMIDERAELMREMLGGWVWHRPWDGVTRTPHITCKRTQPAVMKSAHSCDRINT